jgi:hypothetical protein
MDSDDEPISNKLSHMDVVDSDDDKPLYTRVQRRASAGMLKFICLSMYLVASREGIKRSVRDDSESDEEDEDSEIESESVCFVRC